MVHEIFHSMAMGKERWLCGIIHVSTQSHEMVPDDTVHKGTSKRHKKDEKAPICGAWSSINI